MRSPVVVAGGSEALPRFTTMDDYATHDGGERLSRETSPTDRPPRLTAEIALPRNGPAECTLFPPNLAGFERTTAWITAEEGSFVGLTEMA